MHGTPATEQERERAHPSQRRCRCTDTVRVHTSPEQQHLMHWHLNLFSTLNFCRSHITRHQTSPQSASTLSVSQPLFFVHIVSDIIPSFFDPEFAHFAHRARLQPIFKMPGGKGKSSGGKSSGGKTSAEGHNNKKQQSHSARAGLQVRRPCALHFFFQFCSVVLPRGRDLTNRGAAPRCHVLCRGFSTRHQLSSSRPATNWPSFASSGKRRLLACATRMQARLSMRQTRSPARAMSSVQDLAPPCAQTPPCPTGSSAVARSRYEPLHADPLSKTVPLRSR